MHLSSTHCEPVFKPNKSSLEQHSFFAPDQLLPRKYQERVVTSWSHTLRHDVLARIDEHLFAVLYSEEASRPNAPINVIVGADIIKAGFGWSDLRLADAMVFDFQVRHALGLDDLAMEVPELRTMYNWRRRVRDEAVTTDGGYTGPVAEEACEGHEVELRATGMRGGESRSGTFGWECYEWRFDGEGGPAPVRCPQGAEATLESGRGEGRYIARFAQERCAGSPFFNNQCRVVERALGPSLYVSESISSTAVRLQRLRPDDKPVRAVVEATIRSVKHPFPQGKLPVRGLARHHDDLRLRHDGKPEKNPRI